MRVISKKPLREFWEKHRDAKAALQAWYEDALRVEWHTRIDVKNTYGNASLIAGNRVIFNIKGNDYRLVVKVHYDRGQIYIRFVGTHREYDEIDAERRAPGEITAFLAWFPRFGWLGTRCGLPAPPPAAQLGVRAL